MSGLYAWSPGNPTRRVGLRRPCVRRGAVGLRFLNARNRAIAQKTRSEKRKITACVIPWGRNRRG